MQQLDDETDEKVVLEPEDLEASSSDAFFDDEPLNEDLDRKSVV
jgi:hypothetical protein